MVHVIGAGLAGCEATYQLAKAGIPVTLYEMKPKQFSPAHKYAGFAELVCSNSLKAKRVESAAGLLKAEMEVFGSILLRCAKQCEVPAGGALAVDRYKLSDLVTQEICSLPQVTVVEGEVDRIPAAGPVVVATGPLTSPALSQAVRALVGSDYLSFHDAAAPIVTAASIDMEKAFFAARYGRGEPDYINCPMEKEEYEAFYDALIHAESVELKDFEKQSFTVYEGCMPVEVMAKRGPDTLRFGPLKPVGLIDPRTQKRSYAVVQLRAENSEKSLYNLVGFQTNLKFPEQKRVFSMIPGLSQAEFVRYGVMHRNTFIDSPRLLDFAFRLKKEPRVFFAGQITGVEGYTESAASGILAGYYLARQLQGKEVMPLPRETMLGSLTAYISDETVEHFQPMGANMGILPGLTERIKNKQERYAVLAERSLGILEETVKEWSK